MPEVKALLFDVFGTVVDWRAGVARGLAPFLARHAVAADAHALADAWRRRYQPAMEEVRSGRRPFVKLDTLHRENLQEVLREIGLEPSAVPPDEIDDLVLSWHRLDPWPDAVEGLRRLKTRHIVAPLSNGNVSLMVDLARWGGLPWDVILGAEIAGAYKPSPEAYLRSVALLDLAPHEACLVAAHNGDLAAARACGLRTAFVPRPGEHGPGQTEDLHPEADWDIVAQDFGALADRLGAP
ncbi:MULTISPECIES: haloacid dehalogenase type II [unclassified Aureimonas]|uniref:haloacid dehalogenase type II n=1 Tax=unclassified Aureimonas TaxID=2615206 RepID=UPI0006FD0CDD|nr:MULTISPECIES: haloacid dehalogenase type II [unclassified Aureimonas]KQT69864.1 haloacid dehalogenase [Aureimonas sp. Leaf427]KQT75983.1 haloacid dehalogenase [Aureimonas sp. Leaf460]